MFKKKVASAASGQATSNKFNLEEVMKIGSEAAQYQGQTAYQSTNKMDEELQTANIGDEQRLDQIKEFRNEKKLLQSMTRGLGTKALSLSLPETLGSLFDVSQQKNLTDYGDRDDETRDQLNQSEASHLKKRAAGNKDEHTDQDGGEIFDTKTKRINTEKLAKIEQLSRAIKDDAKNRAYWSVGMIEVDIGLERKIANIEATEALKRDYLIQEFVKGVVSNPNLQNGKIQNTSKDRSDPIQNVAKWIFKPQGAGLTQKEKEKKELHELVKSFKHEGKGQRANKVLGGLGIRLGQLPAKLLEEEENED
jgi:Hepatocellular carcinoma-associated antigen 59